jgi:hypothetical protein
MSSTAEATVRFPIRFTGANRAMVLVGFRRANSFVDVGAADVTIRMGRAGWGFRATLRRDGITSVTDDHDRVLGWGVHGWRGVWLVNGSSSRIVRIEVDPPTRARVMGIPVRLRALRVSVDDPAGLRAALAPNPRR